MIIGGVAVSLLGRPRLTQDVDALAVLPEAEWEGMLAAAADYGIGPRIENAMEFARRSRVLLLRHNESRVEDLLVMKAIAHRSKDLQDIEVLLEAHPDVDLNVARQWIREFAVAATMPELLDDFEQAVSRARGRK